MHACPDRRRSRALAKIAWRCHVGRAGGGRRRLGPQHERVARGSRARGPRAARPSPGAAIVPAAPTPLRFTGAVRTTQWPASAPAHASITLSELRRTSAGRRGRGGRARRGRGSARAASGCAKRTPACGAVDVDGGLLAALRRSTRRSPCSSSLSTAAILARASRPTRVAGSRAARPCWARRARRSHAPGCHTASTSLRKSIASVSACIGAWRRRPLRRRARSCERRSARRGRGEARAAEGRGRRGRRARRRRGIRSRGPSARSRLRRARARRTGRRRRPGSRARRAPRRARSRRSGSARGGRRLPRASHAARSAARRRCAAWRV